MKDKIKEKVQKNIFYEIMRIIAICCVIFNHTGDQGFSLFMVTDNPIEYVLSMLFAILCKVGVPIFFMISGALLIPKDEDLKTLFTKRVLRIAVVIVFFSLVLYIRQYLLHPEYGFGLFFFAKTIYAKEFVTPYWFLYSYIAILLLLPFVRRMAQNMTKTEYIYLVVLGFLFCCVRPVFDYFLGAELNLKLFICEWNILFFLLGYGMEYVLKERDYCIKGCILVQVVAMISVVVSGVLIYCEYKKVGIYTENYISTFVMVQAVALFYSMKCWVKKIDPIIPMRVKKMILCTGSCTFGIYLLEEILRTDLDGIFEILCPTTASLIVCAIYIVMIMVIGTFVVWILKHVPRINKML